MLVQDLGQVGYREAWVLQEAAHERVLGGGEEELLLVEHPPVITFGRRPGVSRNLVATAEELARRGVEVVESDRGGDITFHGPGQLVAYPIVRLADHKLSVSGYVHKVEELIVRTVGEFGIVAHADPGAVGVWVRDPAGAADAKIGAIGVRIRRGVSMHGLALNVTTDLSFFDLIVPCGLAGRAVTSMTRVLRENAPRMGDVKDVLVRTFVDALARSAG
jgi:lipoyl(octanoyl) transferase